MCQQYHFVHENLVRLGRCIEVFVEFLLKSAGLLSGRRCARISSVISSNSCLRGKRYRPRAMSALIAALRTTRLTHRTIGGRLPRRTCRAFAAIASNCLSASNGPLRRVSACSAGSLPRNVATQRRVVSSKAILCCDGSMRLCSKLCSSAWMQTHNHAPASKDGRASVWHD